MSGVQLSEHAAETLRAATDGNPFFIREIANFLSSQHCLVDHREGDLLPAELTLPGGVTAVINRRVDRQTVPRVRPAAGLHLVGHHDWSRDDLPFRR